MIMVNETNKQSVSLIPLTLLGVFPQLGLYNGILVIP